MAFWRSNQGIDSELRGILTRVEEREPSWLGIGSEGESGYAPLRSDNVKQQEWALTDSGPWSIYLKFVQDTSDGSLETTVLSCPHWASVRVTVDPDTRQLRLFDVVYMDAKFVVPSGQVVNRAAVQHLREWVRQHTLPQLEAAKSQRESASQQRIAELDAMRKKYLS